MSRNGGQRKPKEKPRLRIPLEALMPNLVFFSPEELSAISEHFAFEGSITGIHRYGNGHINDTFLVEGSTRYILQRLNTSIFKDPKGVMKNIVGVSAELADKVQKEGGDPRRECMSVIPAKDGRFFYTDPKGDFWRAYLFIEHSLCLDLPRSSEDFRQSAFAFGRFQYGLRDYPTAELSISIPHFHDTPKRYQDFLMAVSKDPKDRKKTALKEIHFVEERQAKISLLQQELEEGKLPMRVTHNDTKLNNVLLDDKTGKALAVIDLDTIMPGSALYDFGDSIRFGANTAKEDEKDLSKVTLSLPLFQTYVEGYLEGCNHILSRSEIEQLPLGAYTMTMECGMRFLSDYLEGDTYFRIAYPEHNLVRARDQFALALDMERKTEEMKEIVKKEEGK
jgi:hypothetical protein